MKKLQWKEAGHTPGPWEVRGQRVWNPALGGVGDIAHVFKKGARNNERFETDQEAQANARLIAAAPELLEICRLLTRHPEIGLAKMEWVKNRLEELTKED